MAFDVAPTRASVAHTPKGAVIAKSESKTLAPEYRERIALYVTNTGEAGVWLALGETAKANEGPFLAAKTGATVIENYSGPVSVVTEAGESRVTFAEV